MSQPPRLARRTQPRRGVTLIEQLVVLVLVALLSLLTIVGAAPVLDAIAVTTASRETADLLAFARDHAIATGQRTAVRFDEGAVRVVVHAGHDTVARGTFSAGGLRLEATRDSMAYGATGLGVGAANTRIVLTRGRSADTITISRLGRVSTTRRR